MRRPGLSLVETLVVIGIIAALLGLLVPAVQKVRASAGRTRSQNNLRQLAIAAHDYAAQNGQLLPGNGNLRYDGAAVVFFDVLPFLEQGPLYRTFGVSGGVIVPPAGGGPAVVVPTYVGPMEYTLPERVAAGKACSSYTPNPSVFGDNGTLAGLQDGTSATTLFSDRLMMCRDVPNPWFAPGPDFLVFGASLPLSNFAPAGEACDPERVCAPDRTVILVAMADGSTKAVGAEAAARGWVNAANPADGADLGPDW